MSEPGSFYDKQAEGVFDRARPQLLSIEDPVSGSFDVDFLLQTRPKTLSAPRELIAIEVKSGDRFKPAWTSGLKTLLEECPESVRRGIVVYQGTDHLVIDGIDILPAAMFLDRLHADRLFVAEE